MEIVGINVVSGMTGATPGTLRYWRANGEGPPSFKMGRRVVYRRSEVEKWIAEQEAATLRGGRTAV